MPLDFANVKDELTAEMALSLLLSFAVLFLSLIFVHENMKIETSNNAVAIAMPRNLTP